MEPSEYCTAWFVKIYLDSVSEKLQTTDPIKLTVTIVYAASISSCSSNLGCNDVPGREGSHCNVTGTAEA